MQECLQWCHRLQNGWWDWVIEALALSTCVQCMWHRWKGYWLVVPVLFKSSTIIVNDPGSIYSLSLCLKVILSPSQILSLLRKKLRKQGWGYKNFSNWTVSNFKPTNLPPLYIKAETFFSLFLMTGKQLFSLITEELQVAVYKTNPWILVSLWTITPLQLFSSATNPVFLESATSSSEEGCVWS